MVLTYTHTHTMHRVLIEQKLAVPSIRGIIMVSICAPGRHTHTHTQRSPLIHTESWVSSGGTKTNMTWTLAPQRPRHHSPLTSVSPSIKGQERRLPEESGKKVFKQGKFTAPRRLLCHFIVWMQHRCMNVPLISVLLLISHLDETERQSEARRWVRTAK